MQWQKSVYVRVVSFNDRKSHAGGGGGESLVEKAPRAQREGCSAYLPGIWGAGGGLQPSKPACRLPLCPYPRDAGSKLTLTSTRSDFSKNNNNGIVPQDSIGFCTMLEW
jgi:hypothetical protein